MRSHPLVSLLCLLVIKSAFAQVTGRPSKTPTLKPTPATRPTKRPSSLPTRAPTKGRWIVTNKCDTCTEARNPSTNVWTLTCTCLNSVANVSVTSTCFSNCCPSFTVSNINGTLTCSGGTCTNSMGESCAPTSSPTKQPTTVPSPQPTTTPSQTPTYPPTNRPTPAPSRKPTTGPSKAPSNKPSQQPTSKPTIGPTLTPTIMPTQAPTPAPTNVPSTAPTRGPTARPSVQPTKQPSQLPSQAPTMVPTKLPTQPTRVPTLLPSNLPTIQPTIPTWTGSFIYSCTNSTQCALGMATNAINCSCGSEITGVRVTSFCFQSCCPSMIVSNTNGTLTCATEGQTCVNNLGQACSPTVAPTIMPTAPTVGPTNTPTTPTFVPTTAPTTTPSAKPSSTPTQHPSAKPSSEPTQNPSTQPSSVPTPAPTTRPTISQAQKNEYLIPLEQGNNSVVSNIQQLALGYSSFYGLLPHEQYGRYMRNPIFNFHLNQETIFLLQQGQYGTFTKFDQPLEYYVSSEDGSCQATQAVNAYSSASSIGSIASTAGGWGIGSAITYKNTPGSRETIDTTTSPKAGGGTQKDVTTTKDPIVAKKYGGAKATLAGGDGLNIGGKLYGNSDSTKNGYKFGQKGYSKSVETTVKRAYYSAGLRLDRLTLDSFTLEFRKAVKFLATQSYDFTASVEFILTFGNYVYDNVMMGARLSRYVYLTESSSSSESQTSGENSRSGGFDLIVKYEHSSSDSESTTVINGRTVKYGTSSTFRVGEMATTDMKFIGADQLRDDCRIGNSILPQMIGFDLRPLWDVGIPLELFLNSTEAGNFRNYIYNATADYLLEECLNDQGQNCTTNGGVCVPDLTEISGNYTFKCVPITSTTPPKGNITYKFAIYINVGYNYPYGSGYTSNLQNSKASLFEWSMPNNSPLFTATVKTNPEGINPTIVTPGAGFQPYLITVENVASYNTILPQCLAVYVCPLYASPQELIDTNPLGNDCYQLIGGNVCPKLNSGVNYAIGFSLVNSSPQVYNLTAINTTQLNTFAAYTNPGVSSAYQPQVMAPNSIISIDELAGQFNIWPGTNYLS